MGADKLSGGLICLISRDLLPVPAFPDVVDICQRCPGRAEALEICRGRDVLCVAMVHNERLGDCVHDISNALDGFVAEARRDPMYNFRFVVGDGNFQADG